MEKDELKNFSDLEEDIQNEITNAVALAALGFKYNSHRGSWVHPRGLVLEKGSWEHPTLDELRNVLIKQFKVVKESEKKMPKYGTPSYWTRERRVI